MKIHRICYPLANILPVVARTFQLPTVPTDKLLMHPSPPAAQTLTTKKPRNRVKLLYCCPFPIPRYFKLFSRVQGCLEEEAASGGKQTGLFPSMLWCVCFSKLSSVLLQWFNVHNRTPYLKLNKPEFPKNTVLSITNNYSAVSYYARHVFLKASHNSKFSYRNKCIAEIFSDSHCVKLCASSEHFINVLYIALFQIRLHRTPSTEVVLEIARPLSNPQVHYRIHKSRPLDPILSQLNSLDILTSCYSMVDFNTVLPCKGR
jgi:hypothetical protein